MLRDTSSNASCSYMDKERLVELAGAWRRKSDTWHPRRQASRPSNGQPARPISARWLVLHLEHKGKHMAEEAARNGDVCRGRRVVGVFEQPASGDSERFKHGAAV